MGQMRDKLRHCPRRKEKKGESGKKMWAEIRRGRDGKTLQLRRNKIDTEIKYEKCSII